MICQEICDNSDMTVNCDVIMKLQLVIALGSNFQQPQEFNYRDQKYSSMKHPWQLLRMIFLTPLIPLNRT